MALIEASGFLVRRQWQASNSCIYYFEAFDHLSGWTYLNALGVKVFSRGSVSRHLTLAETRHPLTKIAGVTVFWCQKSYPGY